ncbi:hypothetical protein LZ578_02545 [Jeotgalibaca sp. MA1X17-3]|uniref:hypothetical protein n=1 Tax=Jeotgalibaca sp. MA1X17-3 TaxID=2908211 RepID=UPI001F2C7A3D|nr:hypothetical protein [Jeotgalibaca sp. MA1X17-3]UJF16039.1 hypothetical protein LZ578_02545 [Jeotgalibaca sp. MA1X17-3]
MKRPKNESVSNQGCGIFFLMVLAMMILLSIPFIIFINAAFFEKQMLISSGSPDDTYHIEISIRGHSNEILIEEVTTSSELSSFIETELLVDVASENIVIEWLSDTAAQIVVTGRDGAKNYFYFNANAEKEKIEQIF